MELNGSSETISELTGTTATNAIIENGSSTAVSLSDIQGGNTTYAGTMSNGGSGTFSFGKYGGGTLTLSNTGSSYTGTTTIDSGVLKRRLPGQWGQQ